MLSSLFHNVLQYIKRHAYSSIVLLCCAAFLVLCYVGIRMELLWVPYLSFAVVGICILFLKTDSFFYLTAFIIPFSIELREIIPSITAGFSLPGELMLACLTLFFIIKIITEPQSYPLSVSKHKISICIYFYLFWMLVTCITSTMPAISFKFWIAKIWLIVPSYFFFAIYLQKGLNKSINFLLCYAVGLAIVVVITTIKHLSMGDVRKVAYWVMSPFYNDHTSYGAILAFFTPILALIPFLKNIKKWQRGLSIILLLPILVGLYLSYSRAAWLSLIIAIGLGGILLLKIKFKTVFGIIFTALALLFVFQNELTSRLNKNEQDSSTENNFLEHIQSVGNITTDASNVERINRWYSALSMFEQKPVFGFGPGTYQFQYAPYQSFRYKTIITTNAGTGGNAHSEYFGPLSESGLLGMASVLALVLVTLVIGIRTYQKSKDRNLKIIVLMTVMAFSSYFFHGILNNFLDTEKLAVPIFVAIAIIVSCNIKQKNEVQNYTSS